MRYACSTKYVLLSGRSTSSSPPGPATGSGAGSGAGTTRATPRRSGRCAAAIERGDVYQVNLVQHLSAPFAGDPAGLAERARAARARSTRAARGRRLGDRLGLARALPRAPRARVWTMPIKGTRPLGDDVELRARRRTRPST